MYCTRDSAGSQCSSFSAGRTGSACNYTNFQYKMTQSSSQTYVYCIQCIQCFISVFYVFIDVCAFDTYSNYSLTYL